MFSNGSSVAPKLVNSRKYLRRQIPNTWDCEPLTCNATKPSHILSNVHGMCFEDQTRRPGCNLLIVKHCNTREEHPSPIYAALPIIGKLPSLEFKSISPQYSSHTTLSFFSAFSWPEDGYFPRKQLFSHKATVFAESNYFSQKAICNPPLSRQLQLCASSVQPCPPACLTTKVAGVQSWIQLQRQKKKDNEHE